eukprot:jgi/Ulvmu1/8133/UM040_0029.1
MYTSSGTTSSSESGLCLSRRGPNASCDERSDSHRACQGCQYFTVEYQKHQQEMIVSLGTAQLAALQRLQNCRDLVSELGLDNVIQFKVYQHADELHPKHFLVVINVTADDAFHTYNTTASASDLALFRGQILTCSFASSLLQEDSTARPEATPSPQLLQCSVSQAFLPKFHTRAQDKVNTAQLIRDAAAQRFMMVSVKHSGSLAMVSSETASSKNSVSNTHAAAAVLLLQTHYARLAKSSGSSGGGREALASLRAALARERACVSFEAVTRCLGHHGQLPAGEYLVTTAMTTCAADATLQVAEWSSLLDFSTQHGLPLNDTWVIWGADTAAAATAALQAAATAAPTTAAAIATLDNLLAGFPGSHVRIAGTYPHAEWQGSRIEGFVVAQGEPVSAAAIAKFEAVAAKARGQQLSLASFAAGTDEKPQAAPVDAESHACGLQCAADALQPVVARSGGRVPAPAELRAAVGAACGETGGPAVELLGDWVPCEKRTSSAVLDALRAAAAAAPLVDGVFAARPTSAAGCTEHEPEGVAGAGDEGSTPATGSIIVSRRALGRLSDADVAGIAGTNQELLQQLRDLIRSREADSGGAQLHAKRDRPPYSTMRALSGALSMDSRLRYKVKMWMYSAAPARSMDAPSRDGNGAAAADEGGGPANGQQQPPCSDTAASAAAAECVEAPQRHVSYCMMTAIIRNGLAQLKQGRLKYLEFARNVAQNVALTEDQMRDVAAFADAWHAWATQHAPDVVRAGSAAAGGYLNAAERFVEEFVNGKALDGGGEAGVRFRGIMLMVGFEPDVVAGVAARLGAQCEYQGRVQWSAAMAVTGTIVPLVPWTASISRGVRAEFWAQVAPDLLLVHRPLPRFSPAAAASPDAKRLAGCTAAALKLPMQALRDFLQEQGAAEHTRILQVGTPQWAPPHLLPPPDAADGSGRQEGPPAPAASAAAANNNGKRPHANVSAAAGDDLAGANGSRKAARNGLRRQSGGWQGPAGEQGAAGGRRQARGREAPRVPELREWAGAATASAMVDEIATWAGNGAPERVRDPAVVVVFIGIPGIGKGMLCAELLRALPEDRFKVVHQESDAMKAAGGRGRGPPFWPAVAQAAVSHRGDGRATVVLADKNAVDSPAGNFEAIAEVLAPMGVPIVTVSFGHSAEDADEDSRHHASLDAGAVAETACVRPALPDMLIALCMLRVLRREDHVGNLTPHECDNVLQIVNNFAAPFARLTVSRLRQRAACFGSQHVRAPALCAMRELESREPHLQRELLSLLSEAKEIGGFSQKATAATADWEARMRACLERPVVASLLDTCQMPVRATAAPIVQKLGELLQQPVAGDAAARGGMHADTGGAEGLAGCEYIAIMNLPVKRVVEAWDQARACAAAVPAAAAAMQLPRQMHVTLWHRSEAAEHADRDRAGAAEVARGEEEGGARIARRGCAALAAAGERVRVDICGFDCSDDIVAARVRLAGVPPELRDVPRPHATMWHAAGVPPQAAARLQERVRCGEDGVDFLALPEPLVVHGTVRAVPLPSDMAP